MTLFRIRFSYLDNPLCLVWIFLLFNAAFSGAWWSAGLGFCLFLACLVSNCQLRTLLDEAEADNKKLIKIVNEYLDKVERITKS